MSFPSAEPDLLPLARLLPAVELLVPCHSCASAFPPHQCQETKRNPVLKNNLFLFFPIREVFTYKNSQRQISEEKKEHKQHKIDGKMVGVLFNTFSALVSLSITVTRQPTQQFSKAWQAEIE